MATGTGKTVVMAMLIAWHTLNKLANRQDSRFSDAFLIVAPGITIRDRLRVLLPNDPQTYYRQRDIVPADLMPQLHQAKIVITNFHAFLRREKVQAGKLTKEILAQGEDSAFTETPAEMVRRVCRELGNKQNLVVINDEAHHCYRRKPDGQDEELSGEERREAEKRAEEARVWISGLEAVKDKLGLRAIYDLSATPFFLRGSGYSEGTLFPWVVSDFSLIDAIELGLVKVPRVPVEDNAMMGDYPVYRTCGRTCAMNCPRRAARPMPSPENPSCRPSCKAPCTAFTTTTRRTTNSGRLPKPPAPCRRRSLSWCAATPTPRSCCTTTSQAGKSRLRTRVKCSCQARCRCSRTSKMAAGRPAPTPS